jgi:hypothetical protein
MKRILEPGAVRIKVIGGSAGSLPALKMITGEFPGRCIGDWGHKQCNAPPLSVIAGVLPTIIG